MGYTQTGKNHLNLHTAGQVPAVATHLVMGIDWLKLAPDDTEMPLSDRYTGAFRSASIPITHTSLVEQDIIFASSYDTTPVPMFLGNVMGLVYESENTTNRIRIRKNIFNNFTDEGWVTPIPLTPTNTPTAWPSVDGGMILGYNQTVHDNSKFSLDSYQKNDMLSIPVFFYGGSPTGGHLSFKFHNSILVDGEYEDKIYTLGDSITSSGAYHKFANGNPALNNGVPVTTNLNNPQPTVWQKRLDDGIGDKDIFFKNLDSITQVDMTWMSASTDCLLYVGSPQITPDYDADTASIVIAQGKMNKSVVHPGDTYMSAEYRIRGIQ